MNYLNKTVLEMREEIFAILHEYLNAESEETNVKHVNRIEKILENNILQSFTNGIQVGRKQREYFNRFIRF